MDPERVRAYLQVACAGLGFDIGEVWWTSNDAALDEPTINGSLGRSNVDTNSRRLRFVQLYTSKSYENRRSELVNPPTDEKEDESSSTNDDEDDYNTDSGDSAQTEHRLTTTNSSADNLQKHVLSPRLVDAIAKTAQVVWANSMKQEGLIGRSDIRLQTAVGMPVAVDDLGNMCVVVMFSPNNIQSTDDAIEYLQSISRSATTASIPCLLPVFDTTAPHSNVKHLTYPGMSLESQKVRHDTNALGEGVSARFVSFNSDPGTDDGDMSEPEIHNVHELANAPKDTFGIPMLPTFAELGYSSTDYSDVDVFDEASYGIWATVMDTLTNGDSGVLGSRSNSMDYTLDSNEPVPLISTEAAAELHVALPEAPMSECRRTRLEEFCVAFLDMSVFDLADVWIPVGDDYPDCLRHVTTVSSTERNLMLNEFAADSAKTLIKFWMGAVGRAYSSGNPVWSANPNVFVDPGRSEHFQRANIMTVLAVPVFSGKSATPACVVACYSLVRSGSVPFVLRFVQQALRLLWDGLDTLIDQPHEGRNIWHDVAPADLGEMAADIEMQHHFMKKKRPHAYISEISADQQQPADPTTVALASHLQDVRLPNGETVNIPFELPPEADDGNTQTTTQPTTASTVHQGVDFMEIHDHVQDALRAAAAAAPFIHVSTNAEGTKRANVIPMRPLSMPHSFPKTIVPTESTDVNIVRDAPLQQQQYQGQQQQQQQQQYQGPQQQQPLTVNAAIFVFPQSPVNGTQVQPMETANYAYITNAFPALQTMPLPNAQPTNMVPNDYGVYCMNANESDADSGSSPDLVSYGNKPCRIIGCDEVCVARRPYCVQHSGNRICEHDGCNKCAQGSTRYCIAHGGGRRCTHPGCDKGARDKYFCAAHGGGKRCRSYGCNKSAVGGSTLCTAHGGGRRCDVEGCDKSAQSSTKFCVKHGGGKKCLFDGCEKVARGRTQFCAAHGGGVRCKLEGCNRVAIGKLQLCRAHGGGARMKKNLTHGGGGGILPNSPPTVAVAPPPTSPTGGPPPIMMMW